MLDYNKNLKIYAQNLRNNSTKAEILLWLKLKNKQLLGYQFYRQKPIGNYIVDFYCPKAHLIIELDGSQHYNQEGISKDGQRDKYLNDLGFIVLRFSDREVFTNINGILLKIEIILGKIPPTPLLQRGI